MIGLAVSSDSASWQSKRMSSTRATCRFLAVPVTHAPQPSADQHSTMADVSIVVHEVKCSALRCSALRLRTSCGCGTLVKLWIFVELANCAAVEILTMYMPIVEQATQHSARTQARQAGRQAGRQAAGRQGQGQGRGRARSASRTGAGRRAPAWSFAHVSPRTYLRAQSSGWD
jgi:hypothetical protein